MPPPYCYPYPRPAVTVDLVVFTLEGDALRVLLIQRRNEPFANHWAIPGGFLEIDEPIEPAARRELREETGLDLKDPVAMIGVFGIPGRDPRGRTISVAHGAAVPGPPPNVAGGDDAGRAAWLDPRQPPPLAFDHADILAAGLSWLESGVRDAGLGLQLVGSEFSVDDVKRMQRALFGNARGTAAWLRRMTQQGRIAAVSGDATRFRNTDGSC